MTQLILDLPDALQHQLEDLAQHKGMQLTQYILYLLTRQVGLEYTVQVMSEENISQQKAAYMALRQQWGKASPAQVTEVLAKREEVEPEPELKPEVINKLHRLMDKKQREA